MTQPTPEQSETLHKAYLASMEITHMPQPVTQPFASGYFKRDTKADSDGDDGA